MYAQTHTFAAMKITDAIANIFTRKSTVVQKAMPCLNSFAEQRYPFADAIFLNICELLTDLTADVTWTSTDANNSLFVAFDRFFKAWGKVVLDKLYQEGYVVVGHTQSGEGPTAQHVFHICNTEEYRKVDFTYRTEFYSNVEDMDIYVMRSSTYVVTNKSDRQLCHPFMEFLDNTLNASNTVSARLGAVVVASPKNVTSAPAPYVLNEKDKAALEEQLSKEYGVLAQQKQIMVLPREMSFQVVNLATLDMKTQEKAKMAILAIADRIKVPANQIGIIDANSSKSLSNGSELREGDFNKYQSFERLLDQTFVQMARDMRLHVDYTIYNKPERQTTAVL